MERNHRLDRAHPEISLKKWAQKSMADFNYLDQV